MKLAVRHDPMFWASRLLDDNNLMDFVDYPENQLDIYEEGDKVIAKLKAPGFKKENISISIENSVLSITGKSETEDTEEDKKRKYFRREMRSESFTRSASLPYAVQAEGAEATFKDGILTLKMPKSEEAKPKKIEVK